MNAALGIVMLMFGHYVLPDSEDNLPALHDDTSTEIDVQAEQLKYSTRRMRLPQAPTMGSPDDYAGRDYRRTPGMPGNPYNPNTNRNASANPYGMPMPPIDPNAGSGAVPGMVLPRVSTPGLQPTPGANGLTGGGAGQNYGQRGFSGNSVGGYAAPTATGIAGNLTAPNLSQYRAPTAQQFISQGSGGAVSGNSTGGYGVGANSYGYGSSNNSTTDNRPFGGATPMAPPISPYMNLYNTPTNNGTVSTYHTSVLPAVQQQQFNNQVNATINGVPGTRGARGFGPTYGQDQQMGNGLANPSQFINYGSFGNTGGYFPQSP